MMIVNQTMVTLWVLFLALVILIVVGLVPTWAAIGTILIAVALVWAKHAEQLP